HSTALGKVLLAYLPRPRLLAFFKQHPLVRYTRQTITSKAGLLRELASVRTQGYAVADEEHHAGLRSIAAPIYSVSREVAAAVALNGSLSEAAWSGSESVVERVQAAAREISRRARF